MDLFADQKKTLRQNANFPSQVAEDHQPRQAKSAMKSSRRVANSSLFDCTYPVLHWIYPPMDIQEQKLNHSRTFVAKFAVVRPDLGPSYARTEVRQDVCGRRSQLLQGTGQAQCQPSEPEAVARSAAAGLRRMVMAFCSDPSASSRRSSPS